MKLLDLLKAAAGEAALSSRLGVWRQHVSSDLNAVLVLLGIDSGSDAGSGEVTGLAALATFGSFFAVMPGDNAATIAVGAPMLFPQDGPANLIVRNGASPSEFVLPAIGTYEVSWQVSIDEGAGDEAQLQLSVNGTPNLRTTIGRFTATDQIMNTAVIQTTAVNSILRLINPATNSTALTITPIAGGATAVSAWLVIKRLV